MKLPLKKHIFKIVLLKYIVKKTFSNLFSQKIHFRNCSLKKYIFEINLSKKTFTNLLPQKIHFQKCFLKIALSKTIYLEATLHQSHHQKKNHSNYH